MPITFFNLHPRDLISACQSQKQRNTKNPPKSDDIKRELWCACYKYEGININLETEHFGTTEFCNHHLPSTIKAINFKTTGIKAINFKTTGASNTDSQLSNPTARHRTWAVSTSGHHDQQENTVILQVIITSWLPSHFLVASGTPTVSIFIWVNYDISPTLKPSQSRGFPRTNHLWDGRHVTSLWVFPKLRFRCVQLRLCHLCRRRRSSRYQKALAPVRLCHKNPIANPPPSTGHESHANLPRCPDHAIEEKVLGHRPKSTCAVGLKVVSMTIRRNRKKKTNKVFLSHGRLSVVIL